jgi:hemoglobin
MSEKTLYERLGGYEGIAAFANDLMPRVHGDSQLGRFYKNRGIDGLAREKQLLIDYLCSNAGGQVYYRGRNMKLTHKGMKINEKDWSALMGHTGDTMQALNVPKQERDDVFAFLLSLKENIVES